MNFFDEPQVECVGASGEFKERIRKMKPVVVNRRLHKSIGSKWGPRKSRFKRFLDFLRGLY